MKKILSLFISLTLLFTTIGCGSKKVTKEEAKNKGNMYKLVSLKDANVDVFEGLIPEGWKTNIESNWNIVNSIYPGLEKVTISNPDSTASIIILSQQSYVQNKKYSEGVNYDYYTTYLHYMNASDYLDYFMDQNYSGSDFVKDIDVDNDVVKQLKAFNKLNVEKEDEAAKLINPQSQGVSITNSEYDVTVAKKQYENGLNYIEAFTGVAAMKTNLTSSLSPLLNSESIHWIMPYVIIYQAETKEDFDKYYDKYNFIIANSHFTVDYYAMVEYVSSSIVNAYTSYYAEKSKAGLDAMNNYIDSNYSSTSSASTNDKVMEMWDDVIKEVDSYKLEDGGTIKTSIHNDVVAQNGNEIYIGDKAGIPLGFNQLDKSY